MIKVNNKKVISNLANKSFKANRNRNIFAIIAIALTSILFTSLFTMGIGTIQSLQVASMRQAGGDGHAVLKYIDDKEFDAVKNHPLIKEIAYNRLLAENINNKELIKRHAEFWYYDEVGLELGFVELEKGQLPQKENEVIIDSKTLELLNVPLEIGAPISLELSIKGQAVTREFILSGWWESDPGFNVGQIFASKAYINAHEQELTNTYKENYYMSGSINAYIMFENSMNLPNKLAQVITDSGYSMVETESNYMESNVNWAYMSTNFGLDISTIIAMSSGLVLIMLTGYLIIYNIFQIAVINDIKFYGMLKTIGTTNKQIRKIILKQALKLCIIGIPVGLLLGYFSGKSLVPLLMSNSNYAGSPAIISPDPIIFIASAVFGLITVLISVRKPAKIAGKVSPIEALKYNDANNIKRINRKTKAVKAYSMAKTNIFRNKKRTFLVILSLSLSIITMNTVFTLSNSLDIDKFVSKFVDTDFLIGHANYFNHNHFFGKEDEVSETFIQSVQNQKGFEVGGRFYGGNDELITITDKENTSKENRDEKGNFYGVAVYGLENLPMQRLQLIDGELNTEKNDNTKYILEGMHLDDNGNPIYESANFKVGEKIVLHNYKAELDKYIDTEYTVSGHVAIKTYTNSNGVSEDYTFYLNAEAYKELVTAPAVMSYAFNVADDEEQNFESFLKNYTEKIEPLMNYSSKGTTLAEFIGMKNTLLTIGGILSLIIGIIGVLNFNNSILTSIITRKHEFAILESIGMTKRQLKQMLCFEGCYYALFTAFTTIVLGMMFLQLIVENLCTKLWFMSYQFIAEPLIISIVSLIILGIVIPLISYAFTDKKSIVERLRIAE